jgi:hypothetical protein
MVPDVQRIVPDEVTLEPGYGSGAAGIAAALIHLYLAENGEAPVIRVHIGSL